MQANRNEELIVALRSVAYPLFIFEYCARCMVRLSVCIKASYLITIATNACRMPREALVKALLPMRSRDQVSAPATSAAVTKYELCKDQLESRTGL